MSNHTIRGIFMDIGVKRIIDVKKTKAMLSKYLPEGEFIEDDQQLLDLLELYNKVGRDCWDEISDLTKEAFLEIISGEIDKQIATLLPTSTKKISWKSLSNEKKDFLRALFINSLEAGKTKDEISVDFQAYLVRGKKKFEVLKQ